MPARTAARLALAAFVLAAAGCLTQRQEAAIYRQPTNRVFVPDVVAPLGEEEAYAMLDFDRSGRQDVTVLQLAPDSRLSARYHEKHDLVLVVVRGSAIIVVEETRYVLTPGSAVMLPAFTAYQILPHEGKEDFVALLIFSPPFDGEDIVLED